MLIALVMVLTDAVLCVLAAKSPVLVRSSAPPTWPDAVHDPTCEVNVVAFPE